MSYRSLRKTPSTIETLECRLLLSARAASLDVPAAPGDLVGVARPGANARLAFTDNSTDETGFLVEISIVGLDRFFEKLTVPPSAPGETGGRFFATPTALGHNNYLFRVRAFNDAGMSE